jgi:hypothetical protein
VGGIFELSFVYPEFQNQTFPLTLNLLFNIVLYPSWLQGLTKMRHIPEFVDERHKSWCIHCSKSLVGTKTSLDHVPTESFLQKPRPHNLPKVTVCAECNSKFSRDEQYFVTFLSCVISGSVDPEKQQNESAARALKDGLGLQKRIAASRTEYQTIGGETRLYWKPEANRINNVILKNARGHVYFEYGEPIRDEPASIWSQPIEQMTNARTKQFDASQPHSTISGWPEVGSRMMTRLLSGEDMVGPWVIVQDSIYRYSVEQNQGIRVRSVLWEYLATEVRWS